MHKSMYAVFSILASALLAFSGCSGDQITPDKAVGKVWMKIKNKLGFAEILEQQKHYSYGNEELIIRDFFQDRQGLFFVDVGCAWPVKDSNTYYLEKHLGWMGIGIDALADYAAEWKEKRPRSKFFSCLVSSTSGENIDFYKSEETGLSSVNEWIADGKLLGIKLQNEKKSTPTIALNDLFDREGISTINLLSIDVEGHELEVLAGLDLNRFAPELIVIEVLLFNREKAMRHLQQYGYHPIKRYEALDKINMYFTRATETITD